MRADILRRIEEDRCIGDRGVLVHKYKEELIAIILAISSIA